MTNKWRARRVPGQSIRLLRRDADGSLYDVKAHRFVSMEELRDDLRSGHRFRAHRYDTGIDCTYEVLIEVLTTALPGWKLPTEENLGAALDVLWKGTGAMPDERPRRARDRGHYRRAENTPSSDKSTPQ